MPYIGRQDREDIKNAINKISEMIETNGEMNYAISLLIHKYVEKKGLKYTNLNDAIGILECAKLEFYRTVVSPYEEIKKEANGSVSSLDNEME